MLSGERSTLRSFAGNRIGSRGWIGGVVEVLWGLDGLKEVLTLPLGVQNRKTECKGRGTAHLVLWICMIYISRVLDIRQFALE